MAVAKAIGTTWSVEVDGKDHGSVYTDCDWRFGTLIAARDKFRRMRPDPYASRAPKSLLHVVSTVSQSVAHPRIVPTPGVLYLGASRSAPFPATPPRCSREGRRAGRLDRGEEITLDARQATFRAGRNPTRSCGPSPRQRTERHRDRMGIDRHRDRRRGNGKRQTRGCARHEH
jgi:hypothetical protein